MRMGITACFCCCTLAVSSSVSGDVYVSNLAEANAAGFNISTFAHASSFKTDIAVGYILDWVTLDTSSGTSSVFSQVKIRSDSGGAPGAVLEDLGTFNVTTTGNTLHTLNSTGISLLPNTRYWVTAGETGSGFINWNSTTSTAEVSPGTWTIGDDAFISSDNGASWQPKDFGPPNESSLFSVNATPVNVPSVSNLAETNTVNFDITTWAHASSFLTDGSDYVLDQVTLNTHSNISSGFSQVKIRADSGGAPGAVVEDLGTFNITAGVTTLHTLASTGLSLSPNTRYWVTAGETGDGSASWLGTKSTAEVSSGTWTIGDDDFQSIDGGVSWQPTDFGPANESSIFSVDATVTVAPLIGDLDGDGFVGITDLNIVLGAWNQNVPPADSAADPSGDNFVGIEDLNIVLGNWNAGTPPGGVGETSSNIPEPGMFALLCVGGLGVIRRR